MVRKWLSFVLAAALILSLLTLPAAAASGELDEAVAVLSGLGSGGAQCLPLPVFRCVRLGLGRTLYRPGPRGGAYDRQGGWQLRTR